MWMSEFDICQMYRQAKEPKKMIKTLSELNTCSREDILAILINNGEIKPRNDCVKKKRQLPPSFYGICELYQKGEISGVEAARRCGMKSSTFVYWARKSYDELWEDA